MLSWSRRSVFCWISIVLLADAFFLPFPAFARRTTVTITVAGVVSKSVTLTVPTGQQLGITIANNEGVASTTATSNGSAGSITVPLTGSISSSATFTITIGGDTFSGVTTATKGVIISDQEKNRQSAVNLRDTSGSAVALADSFSVVFDGGEPGTNLPPGVFWDEFALTNSSADSFLLTSLELYQNADGSFFTPAQFDSAAAISSGTLTQDIVAQFGDITLQGNGTLSLSELAAGFPDYDLLVGTASEILPGGGLGPSQTFAIGNQAVVPEPSSVSLLGITVVLAALKAANRRRRITRTVVKSGFGT